jgi:uncharacterized protein with PQ loop repeat
VIPAQGYAVLLGSCFRSMPQIARIVRNRSVEGLSLLAVAAELVAYSIMVAYNTRLGANDTFCCCAAGAHPWTAFHAHSLDHRSALPV